MFVVLLPFVCLVVAAAAMAQLGRRAGHGAIWMTFCAFAGAAPLLFLIVLFFEDQLPFLRHPALVFAAFAGAPLVLTLQAAVLAWFPWPRDMRGDIPRTEP